MSTENTITTAAADARPHRTPRSTSWSAPPRTRRPAGAGRSCVRRDRHRRRDPLILGGHKFTSRFILGSGRYDLNLIKATIENAGTQIVTMALRRCRTTETPLLDYIPKGITMLPNTSGARNAEEAVRIARLAREVCQTDS